MNNKSPFVETNIIYKCLCGCTWRVELQYRRLDGKIAQLQFHWSKGCQVQLKIFTVHLLWFWNLLIAVCHICKASEVCIVSFKDFQGAVGIYSA